ncbi:hypothetical protein Pmani_008567 [Petrolisthes manimaculis]|uniref:5'-nucleotidase n=1 Tax=Petrolisthes manimaculis TaxID=1843537 RepID=A0AAE1Q6K4_9EUCA|nr:hypothetical protein Pmani_008567 [Petrolisthes manimaculis]
MGGGTRTPESSRPISETGGAAGRDKTTEMVEPVTSFNSPGQANTNARMYPTLEKLGLLKRDHIRIKDLGHVEQVLTSIVTEGYSKLQLVVDFDFTLTKVHVDGQRCHCSWACVWTCSLLVFQVIADFDRTLTRVWYNGKKCETCYGIMDNSPMMPDFYREEANQLLARYYPIELDPHMTEAEKIPHMMEWYRNIHALILKCHVNKSSFKGMVSDSNIRLRDGTEELFGSLHRAGVPVLVLSAGIGDVLVEVLQHFNVYTDNVKVVANFFKYNKEGVIEGFQGDAIHMFNKNENAIHSSDYFQRLEGRANVILMGDSLGDVKMAVGVPNPVNVLKIGFLNDKIEERLESFMNNFDLVLIDDQTMDVAKTVLDQLK